MKYRRPRISPADVGCPDDLGPFLVFVGNEFAEVNRRAHKLRAADVREPRCHGGVGENRVDSVVQPFDDLSGRVLGRRHPIPSARLVAGDEFADGGNIRERIRAGCGSDGQRTELACADQFDRGRQRAEIHLHLSAEQIGKRAAAVRHVKHVDAGHQLGQFGRDMGRGPVARRGDVEFAGIGFGIGDELRNCLGWN